MAKVRRGNVILHVDDELVDYYVNQGYNHIEEDGTVIRAALPKDVGTLQLAYAEHLEKIKALEAENAKLKKELSAKKATKKSE